MLLAVSAPVLLTHLVFYKEFLFVSFDREVRAVASFLAYVNVATPPDINAPTIADAISGLRVGRAFRGLGAKLGREAIRAMPMAVDPRVPDRGFTCRR